MTSGPVESDVCVLGAGPHGLAAAVHLRQADPDLTITVLDRSDQWLATWFDQIGRAGIETLRSPIVHHPAPDPFALANFVDRNGLPSSGLPYDPPTTAAFASFCHELIERWELMPPVAEVPNAIRSENGRMRVDLRQGPLIANHVVVATNPHQRPIPDWVWPLLGHQPGLVTHGLDVDLASFPDLTGERVVVIGGGLTAAHLAYGAADRGASVRLLSRCELRIRSFDTDPGWLGPKYLGDYDAEPDFERRLMIAAEARSGGSIPPWMRTRLTEFDGPGSIEISESTIVHGAELDAAAGCMLRLSSGESVVTDRIWLATGTRPDVYAQRCLRPLLDDVATLQGLPIIDHNLRLGPHRVHVMGRAATLVLGPAAGNLWGAQRAAHRITRAITGVDLEGAPAVPSAVGT